MNLPKFFFTANLALFLLCCMANLNASVIVVEDNLCSDNENKHICLKEKTKIDTSIPDHWQLEFAKEKTFNANMLVIQAGLQHDNTVVFIHGLTDDGLRDWLGVIPEVEKNFHVLTFDLPGFGASNNPDEKYSPTNYAKAIHQIVKHYARGNVIIAGFSMGGAITLRYASLFPEDMSKLIVVGAGGILHQETYSKFFMEPALEGNNKGGFIDQSVTRIKDFSSGWVEQISQMTRPVNKILRSPVFQGSNKLNAGLSLIDEDLSEAISTIHHPVFLIWGEEDQIAPLRTAKVLSNRLQQNRLDIFSGLGHAVMLEDKENFNNLFIDLLQKQSTPPKSHLEPPKKKRSIKCNREYGLRYTGHFNRIIIDHCDGIKLTDVTANSIKINNSLVEIENFVVSSDKTAVSVTESVVMMTSGSIQGKTALLANGSRFDLAGVSLTGGKEAIKVEDGSVFIFSISDINSETYSGYIHGLYKKAFGSVDDLL